MSMTTNKKTVSILSLSIFAAVLGAGYELGQHNAFSPGVATAAPIAPPLATSPSAATPAREAATETAGVGQMFVRVADLAMPSVVNIFTTKMVRPRRMPGYDFWQRYFDGMTDDGGEADDGYGAGAYGDARGVERPMALGTGFIIEADSKGDGLILTNNHVIQGADEVKVKFTENDDERELKAELVGRDAMLDVALLRVHADHPLKAIGLGDSDALKVGEWIAALGNPFGHGHSVSHGIVSAKARALPGGFGKYLQVDAPINPGNSGGPLVNLNGEVVGINNAIDARGPGIGFAIPINSVKSVLAELKSKGHIERGYLGIGLAARAGDGAPVVAQVVPGAPAAEAGLKPRDVILKLDGTRVKSPDELVAAVTRVPVGRRVTAEIERGGRPLKVVVRVARRPTQS